MHRTVEKEVVDDGMRRIMAFARMCNVLRFMVGGHQQREIAI
jgi:hypothetical protein